MEAQHTAVADFCSITGADIAEVSTPSCSTFVYQVCRFITPELAHSKVLCDRLCCKNEANVPQARQFVEASNGDLQNAIDAFYATQGGPEASEDAPTSSSAGAANTPQPAPQPGPVPATTSTAGSSSAPRSKPPQQKKKFGSLRDLQQSDSTEGDDDDDKDQEYFAGGDKSGLAVQDPGNSNDGSGNANDHIQRLLHTARQNRPRPPGAGADDEGDAPTANNFRGSGMTLGGEGTESQVIPDPTAPPPGQEAPQPPRRDQMVERTLHLWDDGFSVDDGPLYRYDDPRNARTLEMINRGSAPLDLMNVQSGQAVDVKLEQHRGEKYVRPKKKYRPFESSGNRLGSPTPGAPSTGSVAISNSAAPAISSASTSGTSSVAKPTVDESQPTVRLQIRLADGTRLPAQFNTTATVGQIRQFVVQAHPDSNSRPFVLATTFPTKELNDSDAVIGDMPELKRGGNIVQKWS